MTHRLVALALLAALAAAGCGGKPTLNTAPLTDADKAAIKAEDRQVTEEEKSGSGTATKAAGKKSR